MSQLNVNAVQFLDGTPSWALFHAQDQKSAGTVGGTKNNTVWETRDLDPIVTNEVGGSLSNNEVTLPAGTYYIEASAPGYQIKNHKLRVYDVTGSATLLVGTSQYSGATSGTSTTSVVSGRVVLGGTTTLRLEHWSDGAQASNGLGVQSSSGEVEVYADFKAWRIG